MRLLTRVVHCFCHITLALFVSPGQIYISLFNSMTLIQTKSLRSNNMPITMKTLLRINMNIMHSRIGLNTESPASPDTIDY